MCEKIDLVTIIGIGFWKYDEGGDIHYTGHDHYNSPYSCDDSCGTCSGANCDYCHKRVDEPSVRLMLPSDYWDKICEVYDLDPEETEFPDQWDLANHPHIYKAVIEHLGCEDVCHLFPVTATEDIADEETTTSEKVDDSKYTFDYYNDLYRAKGYHHIVIGAKCNVLAESWDNNANCIIIATEYSADVEAFLKRFDNTGFNFYETDGIKFIENVPSVWWFNRNNADYL